MVSFSSLPPKAKELTPIKACHSLCFRIHTSTLASVSASFRFVSVATDRRNIPTQVSDNPFVFGTRLESASGLYAISNTHTNANDERQALRSLPFKCFDTQKTKLCFASACACSPSRKVWQFPWRYHSRAKPVRNDASCSSMPHTVPLN